MLQGGVGIFSGGKTGAAVGGITGATIGIPLAKTWVTVSISASTAYRNWKIEAINKKVYPIFINFLSQHEDVTNLMCPIAHVIPLIPVKAPCGHVYEEAEICKWLDTKPEGASSCPFRTANFTKTDLQYDYKHTRKVVRLITGLLKTQHNPTIIAGLTALQNNIREINKEVLEVSTSHLVTEAYKKQLTTDVIAKMVIHNLQQHELPSTSDD